MQSPGRDVIDLPPTSASMSQLNAMDASRSMPMLPANLNESKRRDIEIKVN